MLNGPDGILKNINWRSYLWLPLVFVVTIILGIALFWIFTKVGFLKQSTFLVPLASLIAATIMLTTVFVLVNRRQKRELSLAERNQQQSETLLRAPERDSDPIAETKTSSSEGKISRNVYKSNRLKRKFDEIEFHAPAEKHLEELSERYRNSLYGISRLMAYHQNDPVVSEKHVEAAKQTLEIRKRNWLLQLGVAVGGAFLGAFPEGTVNAIAANDINNVVIFMFMGFVGIVVVLVGILRS